MNNPVQYSLMWKVINYKNQKGIFQFLDSWRGNKNEYKAGYIDEVKNSPLPPQYRWSLSFRYKVIGRIQIHNLHIDYEEYKRKQIKFLSILANIGALFSSIKGIIASFFALYSNHFDNHKMIKNILLKKIKKNSEYKNKKYELLPIKKENNKDNLTSNLIINETDDENVPENENLKKISWFQYLLNNIYCKKLEFNVQERIDVCDEIVKTYMSYDCILYNQIMFEQLLMDYQWNDASLKELSSNKLVLKLQNLEFEYT